MCFIGAHKPRLPLEVSSPVGDMALTNSHFHFLVSAYQMKASD